MSDKKISIHLNTDASLEAISKANASLVQMARTVQTVNKNMSASALRSNAAFTEIGNDAEKAAARHVRSAKEIEAAWKDVWRKIKPTGSESENAVKPIVNASQAAAKEVGVSFKNEFLRGAIWKVASEAVSRVFSGIKNSIVNAFSSAFKFESLTRQFQTLVASIDEARDHMADLKELGDTPPFKIEQFAAASRSLMVMTDGVLGYKQSLEMIGDASAATGVSLEQMGHAVGRLFAFIRDGQPLSRAVMELRNMGVLTPEVAQKLQDMQKEGRSVAEIWGEVENALSRYSGAMKNTEATGEGLMMAISSRWSNLVRAFGDAFSETAKGGMDKLLDKMTELEESGDIEEWAERAADAFGIMAKAAAGLGTALGYVWKGVKALVGTPVAFAAGTLDGLKNGEGWGSFSHGASTAGSFWRNEISGERTEEEAKRAAEERQRRIEERRARRAEREEEERARKERALVEADIKRMERESAENAAKKVEEDRKWEQEKARMESEMRRLEKAAAAERERLDRKAHQKRMAELREEIALQNSAANERRSVAAAAISEFERAFSMWRDPSKAAAEIGEEKARSADLDRLHRDASRYGGKWRIDELASLMAAGDASGVQSTLESWRKSARFTPQTEALVRAAAAEQTQTTVENELRKIEKNTSGLSEKLDELLSMKGDG